MTSKLTKERLAEIAQFGFSSAITPANDFEIKELARMVLSAMDSEPVAYIFKHPAGRLFWSLTDESNKGHDDVMPVYDSPQSPGSEPATVPGKWIPVSERMPPSRHGVLVGRWWGEKPRWCCKWATYIPGHPDAQSSGWLIPGGSWTPTHWMELPAATQEVR